MINKKLALLIGTSLALSACQTAKSVNGELNAEKIDSAIHRAASSSLINDDLSLSAAEKAYKADPDNEQTALNYASALRRDEYLNRAAIVLTPFVKDPESSTFAKTEYAAIMLAQGQYKDAEKYARKAIEQDENHAEAYHYLGIALDAQGMHQEGEKAFREGLDRWQGDPTTIMNNLALNLAAQEYLDEAAEILMKAQTISPGRKEIERNLRIVTALQQSNGSPVPKPNAKPQQN